MQLLKMQRSSKHRKYGNSLTFFCVVVWFFTTGCATQKTQTTPQQKAAVFTPYYLTPGGGEKFLLSIVASMQAMGYFVDILVQTDNVCQADSCVMEVAKGLRVSLDPHAFSIHVVPRNWFKIWAGPYDLFFALGNEKYPPVNGIGRVNIYNCQFPFDGNRPLPGGAAEALASYDAVVLNSKYTLGWYRNFSRPAYDLMSTRGWLFPRTQILHPPVTLIPPIPQNEMLPDRTNIVMVGRFFAGRQSKGHPKAVEIFADLLPYLKDSVNLIMVGNAMPKSEQYIQAVRALIEHKNLEDRVHLEISAPSDRVIEILRTGVVQWHLTGLGVFDDPASLEHFGISIVEGMSAGCIPIAIMGGATDIIDDGHDGYIAMNADQVANYTRTIFEMPPGDQRVMRELAQAKAPRFQFSHFRDQFIDLVQTTFRMKPRHALDGALLQQWRSEEL